MTNVSKSLSIIDKELTIEGTISSKGQLVIKGTVKGTLIGEDVVIAEDGCLYAETNVIRATIGGKFKGEIKASDEIMILSTGECSGKVICKSIVMESGGRLDAEIRCLENIEAHSSTKMKLKEKLLIDIVL